MKIRSRAQATFLATSLLMGMASALATPAVADKFGQPCNENALIIREHDPNSTMGSPPLVCAGTVWQLAPDPVTFQRQTLGAKCDPGGAFTAVAQDPASGKLYYAMCSVGTWERYRP